MLLKNIHRAYKDEIIRAYGFISKIKIWNTNGEPTDKKVLKMIEKNFKQFREIISSGLDHTFRDRQMNEKEYRIYKSVVTKLQRAYVLKNFEKTANNTDLFINLFLDIGK